VGIFQTLMFQQLKGSGHTVVDVGCGTGLLGIASEPLVSDGGRYIGLDVSSRDIEFCRVHYPPEFDFRLLDTRNAVYAPGSSMQTQPWDLPDECADMVTALSVWTHMSEEVARYYMKEIGRTLRPGRCAIVTVFLLDAGYEESLEHRSASPGRYHMTPQDRWVFTESMYGSETFLYPEWAKVPEMAVSIRRDAWDGLLADAGLTMTEFYPGNWREAPGLYFQDVTILQRG
jgi:SAM-dependent methyltransferase